MATFGPTTGFTIKDPTTGLVQDIGNTYVSKSYIIDNYENLPAGTTTPGLFAWGYNGYGQLGNGASTTTKYSSPIQIGSLTNWKQVASGERHCLAIKTNGTLWGWGIAAWGQLGNNINSVNYSSPIQIGALTNWKQIACGYDRSFAIKTDGTLWAWGKNSAGQLGNGNIISYSSPIQIGSLTNWLQISSSISSNMCHAIAVKTDGTLWGWGNNAYGQLGNGNTISYSSPIQIGSLTNWLQVSTGKDQGGVNHTVALKTDGTLWGWGSNSAGELGNNINGVHYSSPIQIGSLTNWLQVSCGRRVTMAIKTDGTLWGWGSTGTGSLVSSPIQIGSLTNWKQVSAGAFYNMAIKTDGTLWGWGGNNDGELGNGASTTISYSSPIQIGSLSSWKQISSSYRYTVAIRDGYI